MIRDWRRVHCDFQSHRYLKSHQVEMHTHSLQAFWATNRLYNAFLSLKEHCCVFICAYLWALEPPCLLQFETQCEALVKNHWLIWWRKIYKVPQHWVSRRSCMAALRQIYSEKGETRRGKTPIFFRREAYVMFGPWKDVSTQEISTIKKKIITLECGVKDDASMIIQDLFTLQAIIHPRFLKWF